MCFFFNPGPVRRVPIPNRYTAKAKLCFCKNNERRIIIWPLAPAESRREKTHDLAHVGEALRGKLRVDQDLLQGGVGSGDSQENLKSPRTTLVTLDLEHTSDRNGAV
jgi:hypothetical protein